MGEDGPHRAGRELMLTREQRDRWAEELESGRWTQQYESLRGLDDRTCCSLGVLQFGVLRTQGWWRMALSPGQISEFIALNDRHKLSFPEIAKHVRALPVQ